MKVVAKTDIGLKRGENQDRIYHGWVSEEVLLAIVCDGMGGENSGSVASELTVRIFSDKINTGYRNDMDVNSIRNLMISSISATNAMVYETSQSNEQMRGMGTTCVAVIVKEKRAYIINVGDSRVYSISQDDIVQITKDHTMVQMLVEQGKITEDEVKDHPKRNLITRAVGAEPEVIPDYYEWDITDSESLLLCSDGLFGFCDNSDILEAVNQMNASDAVDEMISIAKQRGGGDNISIVLINQ
ncbi:MAG TPA: Stp1/IreP family PP2C-type Ser/Thr phosphatase [Oscillospiraceae bacterium]|nr:Stp1/IreP family PP2C-type Ser/Thr phosphatase [Oscillospiraceae bacterium]